MESIVSMVSKKARGAPLIVTVTVIFSHTLMGCWLNILCTTHDAVEFDACELDFDESERQERLRWSNFLRYSQSSREL